VHGHDPAGATLLAFSWPQAAKHIQKRGTIARIDLVLGHMEELPWEKICLAAIHASG
jgi:hypothetical protein